MYGCGVRHLGHLVLPVLVAVAGLAAPVPARAQDDVKVMTFNVWLGGDVVDFGKVGEVIRELRRRHRRAAGGRGQYAPDRASRSAGRTGATGCTSSRATR